MNILGQMRVGCSLEIVTKGMAIISPYQSNYINDFKERKLHF